MTKTVLITGSDGYIGCLMASACLQAGYEVIGVDTGFYRDAWLYNGCHTLPKTVTQDIRCLEDDLIAQSDVVIHLAELSNDPLGALSPHITDEINYLGSLKLAEQSKAVGVARFLYASSCSVYGTAQGGDKTEQSGVNPLTAYARCKVKVEGSVGALADDTFSPCFFRNATVFGASPRMRFDLVVNNLAGHAMTTGALKMLSDGSPWRPIVHVTDVVQAFMCAIEAPVDAIHNQIYNVGCNQNNYQVSEIASVLAEVFPNCEMCLGDSSADNRSYKVNFDKIVSGLPGFHCAIDLQAGAEELYELYQRIGLNNDMFCYPAYTRLDKLNYLIATEQLNEHLYWR